MQFVLILVTEVWTEDITTSFLVEEGVDRTIFRQFQPFSQITPLDLDDRLVAPMITPKDKSSQYLFCRIAFAIGIFVIAFAV